MRDKRPRQRVELNKKYFYVNSLGEVMEGVESEHPMNLHRFNIGNYFETIEDTRDSKFYKVFNWED